MKKRTLFAIVIALLGALTAHARSPYALAVETGRFDGLESGGTQIVIDGQRFPLRVDARLSGLSDEDGKALGVNRMDLKRGQTYYFTYYYSGEMDAPDKVVFIARQERPN